MTRVVSLERRHALQRQSSASQRPRYHRDRSVVIPLHPRQHLNQTANVTPKAIAQLPWLRRSVTVISALLATSTLSLYGGTVYVQQEWHDTTRELEQLRRQERQLVIATEALRQNVMTLAEQDGLDNLPTASEQTLYLDPAPLRDRPQTTGQPESIPVPPPTPEFPLGY